MAGRWLKRPSTLRGDAGRYSDNGKDLVYDAGSDELGDVCRLLYAKDWVAIRTQETGNADASDRRGEAEEVI